VRDVKSWNGGDKSSSHRSSNPKDTLFLLEKGLEKRNQERKNRKPGLIRGDSLVQKTFEVGRLITRVTPSP